MVGISQTDLADQPTVFDRLGEAAFFQLARAFYRRAVADEIIGPMLPPDIEAAVERQALFLIQFFGGPQKYSQMRGHPRLRARHLRFPIDERARNSWMRHMISSLDEVGIPEPSRSEMIGYFERASTFLINS